MKMFRLLIVAAVVVLQACTVQHVTDLSMPPPGVRVGLVGADAVAIKVSVEDRRADKTSIGTCRKQPSSGMAVTVSLSRSLDMVVRDAVEAEVTARGYRLGTGSIYFLVDITDARADVTYLPFRNRVEGKVSLVATVMRADGRKNFERTFLRTINLNVESFAIMNSFDDGAVEVAKAMGDVIREMLDDPNVNQAIAAAGKAS
jgi:uncharacterized lipoprotein YajG